MPRKSRSVHLGNDLRRRITVDLDHETAELLQHLLDQPWNETREVSISWVVRKALKLLAKIEDIHV